MSSTTPQQSTTQYNTTTTSITAVDINIFGDMLTDADLIQDPHGGDADPVDAVAAALEQLGAFIDWDQIRYVRTGVHDPEHTDILDTALDQLGIDAELDVFFFKFKDYLDDDDVDGRSQAYAKATRRRNEYLLDSRNDYPDADVLVRITDGGISGEQYTRNGIQQSVPVITLSMTEYIDWDAADVN